MTEHWNSTPLLSRAEDLPQDFGDLLSADDVDSLIAQRGLRLPFFRLVQDGEPLKTGTRRAVAGSTTITDLADNEKIRDLHAAGATLVIQSLHRIWPPVEEFCRTLADEIGHPAQCNAYITPAGGARGFAFHHDTHDVFVLQVTGHKHWRVHAPVVDLPAPGQNRSGDGLVPDGQKPVLDVVLAPGDCLYLPRGWVHAAETADDRSVHLTIGVHPTTWLDVLRDITELAADDPAFRQALPVDPEAAVLADPSLTSSFLQRAAAWLADLPTQRVDELLGARLRRAHPLERLGVLRQAEATARCNPATVTRPRRGLRWTLETAGQRVTLTLPDRTIDLPGYAAPAVRRLMTEPGRLDALASEELDEPGVLVLARRLLREGALVVVDG